MLAGILSFHLNALVYVDVSLINERGVENGPELTSELHSTEILSGHEQITLQMRDGPKFRFSMRLVEIEGEVGPSVVFQVLASLYDKTGKLIKKYTFLEEENSEISGKKRPILVRAPETLELSYGSPGARFYIRLTPYFN